VLRKLALPHIVLAAYCAGLCLALALRPPGAASAAAGIAALGAVVAAARGAGAERRARWCLPALLTGLATASLLTGLLVGGSRLGTLERSTLEAYVGQRPALTAALTDLPAVKEDQITLAVDVMAFGGAPLREAAHLRLELDDGRSFALDPLGPLVEGAIVELDSVRVEPLPEPRPGDFDYGRYLRRRGEQVLLEGRFADLRLAGRRGGVQGAIDRLRQASRAHLRSGVRPPVSDVLQGMVLGDDEGVEAQVVDDFRRSGLLHIMAVSGENVVLLCAMWSFVLALLAVPRLARTALLVPLVLTYVLLTGASPSIVRAGVAGVVGLLAVLASRPSDGWLLWLCPAAWLLTVNPNNLFDVSFQLSFGAVLGLLLLARRLTRLFSFLPGPLAEQVGITTAASISTAPVSVLTFGSASLVAVPANVAGGFVLGPIMFLGMLSLLLGFVSSWLSAALNVVGGLFIGFLLEVARLFGRLPWAVYEWQGMSLGLLLAAAALGEALAVCALARRAGSGVAAYVTEPGRRASLVTATATLLAVLLLLAPGAPAAPDRPTVTFLDVGEGAATLVQVPGGPTILIDAGPSPLAGALREHGVRSIDLLVLSHGHADHVAGLEGVIGRLPVRSALLPRPPEPSPALERLAAELRAAGAEVRRCDAPLALSGQGWALRILPTSAPPGEGGNQGENDCALVVVAELARQRLLVPGDAEGEVLAALDLPPCTVVELPHHGSRGGLDAGLLRELGPRLAVVSVGPNTYGHPTAEMLGLLAAAGVPCARTDECGDVALTVGGGGLLATAERGP